MKKSTIITVIAFALGVIILAAGFVLLTDNNISNSIFTTTTTTTGAGGQTPEYDPMDLFNTDVSQYVTLGQYKDLLVEVDMLEVDEEYIDQQIYLMLCQNKAYTKLTEGTVEEGVVFNFDFTGYLDGEAFANGSGVNQDAYILGDVFYLINGTQFIDGFAQGVKGASVGDEFDIDVTFPDPYPNSPALAGKQTVFTVKINYIAEAELTDEWVSENTGGAHQTAETYKEFLIEYVNYEIQQNNTAFVWQKIFENANIKEIPQQEFDYFYNLFRSEVEYYVMMYSMMGQQVTYEEMLKNFGFADDEALKKYVNQVVSEELVTHALIQAENIEISDEEYEYYLELKVKFGEETKEEILENYTEQALREEFIFQKANDIVIALNTLVLKPTENQ